MCIRDSDTTVGEPVFRADDASHIESGGTDGILFAHFLSQLRRSLDVYKRQMLFTIFMYMFASLLVAVAHYAYFQFIDHGFIVNSYIQLLSLIHISLM